MQIKQNFVTLNPCYRTNRKIKPKGIMLHSTACPGVMADKWFSRWNNATTEKCVHAFLDDKIVSQLLPWNHRGWHCAGVGNNTHIGFEMCEPKDYKDAVYFKAAWANAVELCVMLCKQYGLTEKNILSHAEGYKKGIASNHGDPDHWWKYQGKTMDDFRKAVYDALNPKEEEMVIYTTMNDVPAWGKATVKKLMDKKLLTEVNLEHNMLRVLVINDRAGLYD
jgi:N-acetylmuramoyl-L-alanine amidase